MKRWFIALIAACASCWLACDDDGAGDVAPHALEAGLVEEHADGRVEWVVRPNGDVVARLRTLSDEPIAIGEVKGKLRVDGEDFALSKEGDRLVTNVGALEGALTDIEYELSVRTSSWRGTLQVPSEGTKALLALPSKKVDADARGPNGGMVEVIGDQRVEIVLDEESGEVRAYLLDDDNKPIEVGDSELTIGILEEK
jgi:hypothetical protein